MPVSHESRESAVSNWDADLLEIIADEHPWWGHGRQRSPHYYKYLCISAKSSCEVGASRQG
jgi:hypothetical protein